MLNYGMPVVFISSKINFTVGGSFTKTPSLLNNILNYSNAYNANGMVLISSNNSTTYDYTVSSRVNYNRTNNSLDLSSNLNYTNFLNSINFKWIIWEGLFYSDRHEQPILCWDSPG